jgi:polyphosphate kinase
LAKKGKKAEIFMKINSLSDRIMADKIYEAADKGVKVYIICRGVCSIVPRKNLFIKSIVGRFLEHSRIYYFKNGSNHEYYISSADLLTRNLDKRVETLISLKDSEVIKQLEWITDVYKSDQANSFIMTKDGEWVKSKGDFSCHDWFIKHTDDMKKIKKG